jgi:glycosyltransferase involved in cell wall biosynthesis
MLQLSQADAGISPTHWQAAGFPESHRSRISVIHDGIDTTSLRPNPMATVTLSPGLVLSRDDEVVTFLNRQLEPYRGFHIFMRALPALFKQRPKAHVVVVGGDGVSYGAKLAEGQTWRKKMMDEIAHELDPSDFARLHFVGNLPYSTYISLMQVSKLHVYLTYPFVLSWSLLEAMSMGCAILASATAPVQEVIEDNVNGCLIDFFDHQGLALKAAEMLSNDELRQRLGTQAREDVYKRYDLNQICLPKMLAWVDALATCA